jgi:predicted Ser/Thr protein kinase
MTLTLEETLFDWATRAGVPYKAEDWKEELIRESIGSIDSLKKRAESTRWNNTLEKLSDGLVAELESWFSVNYVNTCSVDEFLNTIPPKIELNQYKRPKTNTTTVHKRPFSPNEVLQWSEFENEAKDFVWNSSQRVRKTVLIPVSRPVVGELDVQSCFQFWVLDPFNQVFRQINENVLFIRSFSGDSCVGSPDFDFIIDSDLSSSFELKTLYTLDSHLSDLTIQWPPENFSVKNIVEQVMGYMNFNRMKYALLSSYQNTWFIKREGDRLFVSKAIAFDNLNPTLYRCIGYFTSLVRHSSKEPMVDPLFRRSSRIANQGRSKESSSAGDLSDKFVLSRNDVISPLFSQDFGAVNNDDLDLPDDFSIAKLNEFIGSGFCGKVFKWENSGVTAAVKVCDSYNNGEGVKALQNEAKVYSALRDIQGKMIPRLLFHGEAWGFYFLATNFIEGNHPIKVQLVEENLEKILGELRKRNVVHGDIKPCNMILTPNDELYLLDFSHAKILVGTDVEHTQF